jgi:hypothetical protein
MIRIPAAQRGPGSPFYDDQRIISAKPEQPKNYIATFVPESCLALLTGND